MTEKTTSPLRSYRDEKGWTLAEASDKWGVSLSYLSELETGEAEPSKKMAMKLSKKTGISVAVLMGLESAT